jgi:hypothetical protein
MSTTEVLPTKRKRLHQNHHVHDIVSPPPPPPISLRLFVEMWPDHELSVQEMWNVLKNDDDFLVCDDDDDDDESGTDEVHNVNSNDDGSSSTALKVIKFIARGHCHETAMVKTPKNYSEDGKGNDEREDEEASDEASDKETVDFFLDHVWHVFEMYERRVSWTRLRRGRLHLEAAIFCYGAFSLGCLSYAKTLQVEGEERHLDDNSTTNVAEEQFVPSYRLLSGIASTVHVDPLSTSMIQFALWYLVGFEKRQLEEKEKLRSSLGTSQHQSRTSRMLSLSEFRNRVPYAQLSPKDASDLCIFVSHRWQTTQHPDPCSHQSRIILDLAEGVQGWLDALLCPSRTGSVVDDYKQCQDSSILSADTDSTTSIVFEKLLREEKLLFAIQFFIRGQRQVRLWYDYFSIPQGQDDQSRSIRSKCLPEIAGLCQEMIFLGLISDDYFSRGWCAFELIQHTRARTKLGTKMWTHDADVDGSGANADAIAFLSQTYREFQARTIYGRLCGLLEDRQKLQTTTALLEDLGMRCSNGSDLGFVSNQLVEQIKRNLKDKPLLTWIHPMLSAMGRLLEESLVPPILSTKHPRHSRHYRQLRPKPVPKVLIHFCFVWRNDLRADDRTPDALAANVVFKWRYPDSCMDHLLETRMDFENIAEYHRQLQQAIDLLEEFRVAFQKCSVHDSWETCASHLGSRQVTMLKNLLDAPGYFVQVNFATNFEYG